MSLRLEIKIKSLGIHHVNVAMTLGNMALVHSALGQKEQALKKSSQAHKIFLDNLGPDHPSTKLEARNLSRLTREGTQHTRSNSGPDHSTLTA
jgi:hypothetical protein